MTIQLGGGCGDEGPTLGPLDLGQMTLGMARPMSPDGSLPDDPSLPVQGDIQVAWEITTGAPDVVVAVLDTGIDWQHPDLRQAIWVNPGEDRNGNGIAEQSDLDGQDNDGNGYVDDIVGWDFVGDDNDPMDRHGHGTSVSGVIAATADNAIGTAGYAWSCPVMPIRVRSTMVTNYGTVARGLGYAVENGARVINLSLGGLRDPGPELATAIAAAHARGVLIIGSAGNQNTSAPHYPDAYPEVMSVAAVDELGRKTNNSNYGPNIEVCARTDAVTTLIGGKYGVQGGTSHATPCVAALGALLFARFPHLTGEEARAIIKSSSDPIDAQNPDYPGVLGSGTINFYRALDR